MIYFWVIKSMKLKVQLYQNFLWRGLYFLSVFILNIALARQYEAVQNGWINYITANFALTICLGSLSFEVSILHFSATQKIDKNKLTTFALTWVVFVSIIFYFFFNLIVTTNETIASKNLIRFCATCYVIGIMGINFFVNLFLAHKQYIIANVILLITNSILILLVPGLFFHIPWLGKDVFLYFFFFSFVLQALLLIIAYYLYLGEIKFSMITILELKQLLRYAIIAYLSNLSFYLLTRIDFWFVHNYCTDIDLGLYTLASKISQTLLIIAIIASGVIFVSTKDGQLLKKQKLQLYTIFQLLIVFFLIVMFITILVGKSFFVFVLGKSFTNIYWPLILLIPGILFLSISTLLGAYFGAINKSIYNFYANLIGLIFMIIGNIFLTPYYGITASAIISTLCYGIVMAFCLFRFIQMHHLKLSDFLTLKNNLLFNKNLRSN